MVGVEAGAEGAEEAVTMAAGGVPAEGDTQEAGAGEDIPGVGEVVATPGGEAAATK